MVLLSLHQKLKHNTAIAENYIWQILKASLIAIEDQNHNSLFLLYHSTADQYIIYLSITIKHGFVYTFTIGGPSSDSWLAFELRVAPVLLTLRAVTIGSILSAR